MSNTLFPQPATRQLSRLGLIRHLEGEWLKSHSLAEYHEKNNFLNAFHLGRQSAWKDMLRQALPIYKLVNKETGNPFPPRTNPVTIKLHKNVTARFDDTCQNGYNTLAITYQDEYSGGYIPERILRCCPHLKRALKFHLCSTNGPTHYYENTAFLIQEGRLDSAKSTALWEDASPEDLRLEGIHLRLASRLDTLMAEFKEVLIELGFSDHYKELEDARIIMF